MNIYLVIPTIRSLDFLKAWKGLLDECHLVIVEDGPEKTVTIPRAGFRSIGHYCWRNIKSDFGKDEWIFSRKNAGIRSYGFWKAYQAGADVIITLDDDCYPEDSNFVSRHAANLSLAAPEGWTPTFPHPDFLYTRGFPYSIRNKCPVVISHGLWSNKLDLDAKTQLKHPDVNIPAYPSMIQFIPVGQFFPMSSMNLAFKREIAPLMYFPLMGSDPMGKRWGYDRFDDIWAGLLAKKTLDHLGLAVANGSPFVEHRKASDPAKNLLKERFGIEVNETLWRILAKTTLSKHTIVACHQQLVDRVKFPKTGYFQRLKRAMNIWLALFAT